MAQSRLSPALSSGSAAACVAVGVPASASTKKTVKRPAKKTNKPAKKPVGKVLQADSAAMNWEGVEVPTGALRDRMEHIDKVLQRVRRRDDGTMKLPTAKELGSEIGVGEKTMRETIKTMQDLYAMPVRYNARRFGYEYTEDVAF